MDQYFCNSATSECRAVYLAQKPLICLLAHVAHVEPILKINYVCFLLLTAETHIYLEALILDPSNRSNKTMITLVKVDFSLQNMNKFSLTVLPFYLSIENRNC